MNGPAAGRRGAGNLPRPEGNLARHDVPELFHLLDLAAWTGVLTVTSHGISRGITVIEGRLAFATSSNPDDRLGILLVRQGKISLRQLSDAVAGVKPPKRLGTVLVEQGALEATDLIKAVNEQTAEIIYGAIQWTEGSYRMQEGRSEESITLKLSTPGIILEGIRRVESWSRIERAVGGVEARYALAPDYERILKRMSLSGEQADLLASLEQTLDVQAICEASILSDFEVFRTLWAFRVLGIVQRQDAADSGSTDLDDEGLDLVLGSP